MFADLENHAPDKILQLMQKFSEDPRSDKIDLGVGVYRDANGNTPVMRAVAAAEKQLCEVQTTKKYTAVLGEPAYHDVMANLVLADAVARDQVAVSGTPGGTGAVRQGLELIKTINPDATVWMSDPTWPNHPSITSFVGLRKAGYRYFSDDTRSVDFEAMMDDLKGVRAGDVVLLHGCCHNPTGANLNLLQWQSVADFLQRTGAIPFIDIAYQGFGDGLDEDAAGVRLMAASVPETIIAASCSKNFGIYRERTGALMAVSQNSANTPKAENTLFHLTRQNFSFPPDHGARVVTMILKDETLRADWLAELEDVRLNMLKLRNMLVSELQRLSGSDRFGFLGQHRGMFSRLGATPEQVETLRSKHGIYMVSDSRMNIAGLNVATVPVLANAIIDVGI